MYNNASLVAEIIARGGWEHPQSVGAGQWAAYLADQDPTCTYGVMWDERGAQVVADDRGQSTAIDGEDYADVMDAVRAAERRAGRAS